MGNEANCVVTLGKQRGRGKAVLESSEIIFRSEDGALRLKLPFAELNSANAADGKLRVETPEGTATFELGANAAKWCEKILHPKTRMEKLGVKQDAAVALMGKIAEEFLSELRSRTKSVRNGKTAPDTECIFFGADSREDLSQVRKLARSLKDAAALWIVYPKGQKQVTENDVIAAGRKAGLKDVKVVAFSTTHTALKFVIPVEKR